MINKIIYTGDYRNMAQEKEEKKTSINQKSLANLHPRQAEDSTKEKKFMSVDITDYEDYLFRICKYEDTNRVRYIQSLIQDDMKKNEETYEILKKLDKYNPPIKEKRQRKN